MPWRLAVLAMLSRPSRRQILPNLIRQLLPEAIRPWHRSGEVAGAHESLKLSLRPGRQQTDATESPQVASLAADHGGEVSGGADMNVGRIGPQDATGKPVLIQRPAKEPAKPGVALGGADAASLSEAARGAAEQADALVKRLRAPDLERQRYVDGVRGKLLRGDLDDPQVLRATAQRMLDQAEGL